MAPWLAAAARRGVVRGAFAAHHYRALATASAARQHFTPREHVEYLENLRKNYESPEEDAQFDEAKRVAKEERRQLSRSNLLAEEYARLLSTSSITLFVNGELSGIAARQAFSEAGFSTKRVKNAVLRASAAKLDAESAEDSDHLANAAAVARGLTSLAMTSLPLAQLAAEPGRLAKIEAILPFSDPKDGNYKPNQFLLVGGFIKDHGKSDSNIWLTRKGVQFLLTTLRDQAALAPDLSAITEPHMVFHAKLVSSLRNQAGAIRVPLTKAGQAVSSTLSKIPRNAAGTFAKIKALREEEAK